MAVHRFSRALQEKGLLHGRQLRCMETFVLKLDDGRRLMMEEYRAGSRYAFENVSYVSSDHPALP